MIKPLIRKPLETVTKGWGQEIIIDNNQEYCGKLLEFKKGAKFSNHYHFFKKETFYLFSGQILFKYYNLENADEIEEIIGAGTCIEIPRGCPHQIEALEDSLVIEVSTQHFDSDSFRIKKGDSQK